MEGKNNSFKIYSYEYKQITKKDAQNLFRNQAF